MHEWKRSSNNMMRVLPVEVFTVHRKQYRPFLHPVEEKERYWECLMDGIRRLGVFSRPEWGGMEKVPPISGRGKLRDQRADVPDIPAASA